LSSTAQSSSARVLVVDRSRAFADGIVVLLRAAAIDAQAADIDALDQLSSTEPFTVVVVDGRLAHQAASDGLGRIRRQQPGCQLILIVDNAEQSAARIAELAGAATSLSRHSEPDVLIGAIRAVHEYRDVGRNPASQAIHASKTAIAQLTVRELAVLSLLSQGVSNIAVGESLGISPNTVRTHVRNLLVKLNVHSRAEAIAIAGQPGVLQRDSTSVENTACG
jgi:two-component system response regulator FimZ (fimbrial Z protein)